MVLAFRFSKGVQEVETGLSISLTRPIPCVAWYSGEHRLDLRLTAPKARFTLDPMLRATNAEPEPRAESAGETASAARNVGLAGGKSINDLVREVVRGDPFATRQLLQAIAPSVRSICRGVMGREHPEIEDAIQDCLVDVVRALPQFRFEADVSHYVTKIALRRAIALRQRARARAQKHAEMDSCSVPVTTFDEGIEARASLLRNLLDELGEAQSTALRLRLMLGHSMEEIASITGVSVNTVKTRLRLGKNRLREQLERSGEGRRAR
jgi:RNA polymerase sigma factor (sigma-70 family)